MFAEAPKYISTHIHSILGGKRVQNRGARLQTDEGIRRK
jgi:hypothetical protein